MYRDTVISFPPFLSLTCYLLSYPCTFSPYYLGLVIPFPSPDTQTHTIHTKTPHRLFQILPFRDRSGRRIIIIMGGAGTPDTLIARVRPVHHYHYQHILVIHLWFWTQSANTQYYSRNPTPPFQLNRPSQTV